MKSGAIVDSLKEIVKEVLGKMLRDKIIVFSINTKYI